MKNFKITRSLIIFTLTLILIAGVFAMAWLFGDYTHIFNDTKYRDGDSCFGWIHLATNIVAVIGFLVTIGYFLAELMNDKSDRPFRFLYDKNDYKYRRSSDGDDKEDKVIKPIRWKRWIWLAIALILVVNIFKFGKTIYKQSVFMYNTSKIYRNTYQQKVEEKLGFYDKLWKTYLQKEKITNINMETFVLVTKIIMENRADGQNLTWKWLQENQQIPYDEFVKFYADLSNFITTQREGYFGIEKACQVIANKNNTMIDTFPNNIYNRFLKVEKINFQYGFLSDSTNNVFARKTENLK